MNYKSFADLADDIIEDFIWKEALFTGLDVSNKVKESFPHVRHSEVSAFVRGRFDNMQREGYARTTIEVELKDGTKRLALLYHPESDRFDLDSKYSAQQRKQTTTTPVVTPVAATVSSNGTINVKTSAQQTALSSDKNVSSMPHVEAWSKLFDTQPSLFPGK